MEARSYNGLGPFIVGGSTSVAIESQSSQLLDFVLGRADPPDARDNARSAAKEGNTSADRHSASSGNASLSSASVEPYHFHGLAATQTQTQLVDGADSQKENAPAQDDDAPLLMTSPAPSPAPNKSMLLNPSGRVQSPTKPLVRSRALGTASSEPLSHMPPPQTKAVTFLSPVRRASEQKAPSNGASIRFRRRRSPSVNSEDSFAGPSALQDPDLFLATSRQFTRPLEEFDQAESQGQISSKTHDEDPLVNASDMNLRNTVPHSGSAETRKYSLSSSSSAGRILVANSDTSGTSQDSQRNVMFSQQATQMLDAGDSSMSEHNDDAEVVLSTAGATQRTQEATQPASLSEQEAEAPHVTSVGVEESVLEPSVVSKPRSLLDLVPPEKRYRYMHHFSGNSVATSEASRAATVGTSVEGGSSGNARSPLALQASTLNEELVQDSEQQVELVISPRVPKSKMGREHVVIPPSESDAPDASARQPQEESEEIESDEPMKAPTKPASRASAEGKQKEVSTPNLSVSRKPTSRSPRVVITPRTKDTNAVAPSANTAAPSPSAAAVTTALTRDVPATASLKERPTTVAKSSKTTTGKRNTNASKVDSPPEVKHEPPTRRRRGPPRGPAKGNAKGKRDTTDPPSKIAARATKSRAQTPATVVNESEDDDDEVDSPAIPLAQMQRMDEEETEIADDELAEDDEFVDEKLVSVPDPSRPARKRKRGNTAPVAKVGTRGRVATRKPATRGASTGQPPAKRPRTSTSSAETIAKRFGAGLGTQVFALFKSDSCYYGAEVHAMSGDRAHVKYFDSLEDPSLGVSQLRRFRLRVGDTVIPGENNYKAKVIDDELWASENEVRVEYIEGPDEGLELVAEADRIRIPARVIQSQWKDRTIDVSDIIPALGRKTLKDTPSPSKMSIISSMSSKAARNKLLLKYGFVITLGPGNNNWVRDKDKLVAAIKDSGGTVLGDWLDIFSLQGKHTNGNKRWTLQRDDVKYSPKDKSSVDRVFLIADIHNQKPKFLLALALGIPCVSTEWVERLIKGEDVSWARYLLPAGHSEPLGASVSQMVDLDWGNAAEYLSEIMENRVPHKVLSDASVLCVGPDLLPLPPKKNATSADRAMESSRTVPRIVLSMGAARVEAVADIKHASERDLTRYDYIVGKKALLQPSVRNATYVDVGWIKECLIAGRLFPVPPWGDMTS